MGLGNPDPAYLNSPHNVGFQSVLRLHELLGSDEPLDLGTVVLRRGTHAGQPFVLARPLTWMNDSGRGVECLLRYLEADVSDLVVITDDIDLPLSEIRIRAEGGAGTHRGMRSLVQTLERKDFARIRIGIYPDDSAPVDLAAYVLAPLQGDARKKLEKGVERAVSAARELLESRNIQAVMNRFNRRSRRESNPGPNTLFAPPDGGGCRSLTGTGAAHAASIQKEDECNDRMKSGSS